MFSDLYDQVSTMETDNEKKNEVSSCWNFDIGMSSSNVRKIIFTILLGIFLAFTFDKCISCVFIILILSGLTMSCIPTMPIVFLLCCGILLMHAIDYRNASIRVEVPLENFVYIPTWDDVHKYVHVSANTPPAPPVAVPPPPAPSRASAPSGLFSWFDSEEKM